MYNHYFTYKEGRFQVVQKAKQFCLMSKYLRTVESSLLSEMLSSFGFLQTYSTVLLVSNFTGHLFSYFCWMLFIVLTFTQQSIEALTTQNIHVSSSLLLTPAPWFKIPPKSSLFLFYTSNVNPSSKCQLNISTWMFIGT